MPNLEINNNLKHFGDTTPEGDIRINVSKGDVVNTIIHEKLHAKDFGMSETQVIKLTKKIESNMNLPEMAITLMEAHQESLESKPKGFNIHHTEASKVVKTNTNQQNV